MSKVRETLQLRLSHQQAIGACREAVDRIGWEISGASDGRLAGGEEPPLTSCRAPTWPARFEIEVDPESAKLSTVRISGASSGFGRRSANRLQSQIDSLAGEIRRAAQQEV
jgi:hypothetical protein